MRSTEDPQSVFGGPGSRDPIEMEADLPTGAGGLEPGMLTPDGALALPGTATRGTLTAEKALSPFQASLRRLRRDRRAMISLGVIAFMILVSFFGPLVYEHIGPTLMGGAAGTTPVSPSLYHSFTHEELIYTDHPSMGIIYPMGTDSLGRDILARLMAGVKVSILVAAAVECFDIGLGLIVGTLAGFFGGIIDTFLARFTDLMFAFPALLFAILAAATIGIQFQQLIGYTGRLVLVSLALGVTIWPQMARFVRAQTLQLKEQQFMEAARTVGTSNGRLIRRHIVPNLFNIVMTVATLDVVAVIIGEATISLLGLGVQPPGSSLGLMINDGAITIGYAPWEALWPAVVLAILVLAFSFLGDGISDAFNPRRKD